MKPKLEKERIDKQISKEIRKIIKKHRLPCIEEHFLDLVNYDWLIMNVYLSKDFLFRISNKINWTLASMYQKLHKDVIFAFADKLDIPIILQRKDISLPKWTKYALQMLQIEKNQMGWDEPKWNTWGSLTF